MKLLFITQKLHGQDAFGALWIEELRRQGYDTEALCLEWRPDDALRVLGRTAEFPFVVHSMGKERGYGKIRQIARFLRLITVLHYDRVFIHMSPVWGLFGAPIWIMRRTPVYLWYTHYKMQTGLRMLGLYAKRLFCATPQSLPHYEGNPKKVVVGHGIDLSFWPQRENRCSDSKRLLAVHRLSRSKRLELVLRALALLPEYRLDIYGIEAEADYVRELKDLVVRLNIGGRTAFLGSAPARELPEIYARYRLILNEASETIDKTMLEAMTCGCYPVTTRRNAEAIGLPAAPADDSPEAIASFVRKHEDRLPLSADDMYRVVENGHSLSSLIRKMDTFIREGK